MFLTQQIGCCGNAKNTTNKKKTTETIKNNNIDKGPWSPLCDLVCVLRVYTIASFSHWTVYSVMPVYYPDVPYDMLDLSGYFASFPRFSQLTLWLSYALHGGRVHER